MAYFRTILKGSLGSVENWSTSNNWGIFGLSPDVPDQAAVDGMLLNLRAFTTTANVPTNLRTILGAQGDMATWRVEKRAEDESILSIAEGALTAIVGGTGAVTKTPQDALVLSLRTNTPGARGRGRMYWPALAASLSTQFQLTTPTPAAIAADAKTWLNAIGTQLNNYFIGIGATPRVVLSVRSVRDHQCRDVVQIQVGSVLDTQRRRRDKLPETYSNVTYP